MKREKQPRNTPGTKRLHGTRKSTIGLLMEAAADVNENHAISFCSNCDAQVHNFAGKTSIGMLAAVLKACSLFIGVDSAGMHIAGAVRTPTVTIVGPSSSVTWAPRGRQHRVVYKSLPCVPCHQTGCLEELTIDEVFSVVKDHIVRVCN